MKESILYVDDEIENLEGFEASFYNVFNVFTADSGKKALELLKEKEIQVIVSDQRMPEMSGLELIQKVNLEYPDVICIIQTAYLDLQTAIQAVNMGGIFRYMMKPWDKNEMKMTIDNALETYKLKLENKTLVSELQKNNKELEEHKKHLQKLVDQKTEELNRKNKELAQLNEMKDKFVSSLLKKK